MDAKEQAERATVVAEARSWVGCPYHHQARLKGVGIDCATLLAAVFENCGLVAPVDIPNYSPQWFMHQDAELYMERVLQHAKATDDPKPGDVALWKIGKCFAHGAIIVAPGWPAIIHAYKPAGLVLEAKGTDASLMTHYKSGKPREVKFFTRW
jgi:NlpC/P60 family putative phage cell wall peptidase